MVPMKAPRIPATMGQGSLAMRAIRFEDVPEVLRLVRRSVDHGCRGHYDQRQREAVYASYARSLFVEALGPFDSILAERQGRVVGIAQFDPADDRLRALFVDAAYQQSGVGRALLAEIEQRARRRGRSRLHGAMSLNAVSFYLQAGFRPSGGPEQLTSTDISVPVVRMEKNLRTAAG